MRPGEHAPADEREVVELALELVVEELVVVGRGASRATRGEPREQRRSRPNSAYERLLTPWSRGAPSGSRSMT